MLMVDINEIVAGNFHGPMYAVGDEFKLRMAFERLTGKSLQHSLSKATLIGWPHAGAGFFLPLNAKLPICLGPADAHMTKWNGERAIF